VNAFGFLTFGIRSEYQAILLRYAEKVRVRKGVDDEVFLFFFEISFCLFQVDVVLSVDESIVLNPFFTHLLSLGLIDLIGWMDRMGWIERNG